MNFGNMSRRFRPVINITVLILILLGVWYAGLTSNARMARYSPRDHGPNGMAALASLWDRLGHEVHIVPLDVNEGFPVLLAGGDWQSGTVVFTDSVHTARGMRFVRNWVEAGNTAVVLGRLDEDGLNVSINRELGLVWGYVDKGFQGSKGLPPDWSDDSGVSVTGRPVADRIDDIRLRRPVRGVDSALDSDPLFLHRHAVTTKLGEGWIVAIGDARTLSNRDIDLGDHAALAARMTHYFVPGEPVIMVDINPQSGGPIALIGDGSLMSWEMFWHLLLISSIGLWRVGRRFGSPIIPGEAERPGLIQQVYSVAHLYHRGKAYRRGLRAVYEAACDQVARRLGGQGVKGIDWERAERLFSSQGNDADSSWANLAQRTEHILSEGQAPADVILQLARQWESIRRSAGGRH